jgi:hypothetical protein
MPAGNNRIYILATADLIFIISRFRERNSGEVPAYFTWEGKGLENIRREQTPASSSYFLHNSSPFKVSIILQLS